MQLAPKTDFFGGKILEEGNFFDENYKLPAFPNEKIKDAGQNATHICVLGVSPSFVWDPLVTKHSKGLLHF